ncbi:MAG: SAM-dependent methyltransferase [Candidatus Peribacteria bacterium]|nr:SAM-dependent methyltransferase [Candidatus Peribacteria bacterium]
MNSPSSYSLLDFGNAERLEQWGEFRLIRPDPTATGPRIHPALWADADAVYEGEKGKGIWTHAKPLPDSWLVSFDDIQLVIKLAPYKHTGAFPEQQLNWQWMRERAKKTGRPLSVLNLFAYTGGATMALAKDGHKVTHVDSSKPAIGWAKENAIQNNLPADAVRWILEDAAVFAEREHKRGKTYDAIILDPPAFGHSPTGKTWKVERDLAPLLEHCAALLSSAPSFLVLNGYARNDTPDSFKRLLTGILRTQNADRKFLFEGGNLLLKATDGRELSTGTVIRCSFGA